MLTITCFVSHQPFFYEKRNGMVFCFPFSKNLDPARNGKQNNLKRLSVECRKTKTKVITLTNHNSRKQSNELIRARSKYV